MQQWDRFLSFKKEIFLVSYGDLSFKKKKKKKDVLMKNVPLVGDQKHTWKEWEFEEYWHYLV